MDNLNSLDSLDSLNLLSLVDQIVKDINEEKINKYITEPLDAKNRMLVHELVKKNGLCSSSIRVNKSDNKIIEIYKTNSTNSTNSTNVTNATDFVISREIIEYFVKMTLIPIPSSDPNCVSYYLKILSKYYDTEIWDVYVEEIKEKGFSYLKNQITYVKNCVIKEIEENEEYINFCSKNIIIPTHMLTNNNIYKSQYASKYFISIDIKSANFNYLKHNCQNIKGDWVDFVSKYTSSNFIKKSKQTREIIFGQLGNKKIQQGMLILIKIIDDMVNLNHSDQMKKVICSNDEIIYEISKSYDIKNFLNDVKKIDPKENIYRVEKFILEKLNPHKYFIKKIFINVNHSNEPNHPICSNDSNVSNDSNNFIIKFKNIPKKHIIQCIKHYENDKEISETDKKFTLENEDVILEKNLYFDTM